MHVLKEGTMGQSRAGAGSGLRAWALPTYSDREDGGIEGLHAQSRTHRSAPRDPSHLLRLQPPGREEKGVGARCGPSREEITVSHTPSPPRRELPAVGCSSSVTFAKVR